MAFGILTMSKGVNVTCCIWRPLIVGIKMLKRVTFYKLDAYLLSNIFVIFDFVYSSK